MAASPTYDVIVVGAGNAAICAALSATEQGAKVLMLEKAPEAERGGNSLFTAGGFRFVHDGLEDLRQDILADLSEAEASQIVAGALNDLIAGHVLVGILGPAALIPHAKTGTLRLLAQSSEARSTSLPEIPTLQEEGFNGLVVEAWFGALVPVATPAGIVARLNIEKQLLAGFDGDFVAVDFSGLRQSSVDRDWQFQRALDGLANFRIIADGKWER